MRTGPAVVPPRRRSMRQIAGGMMRRVAEFFDDGLPVGAPPDDRFRVLTGYEGASLSRRLSPWFPTRAHINSILAAEAPLLRARVRQLVANTPYGANASETFACYAVGTGIKPSSLITDVTEKASVAQAWTDWTDEADADGLTDFYGLQVMAARAMFDAGECFIRFRDRRPSDGLSVPMQMQLLEAEQLDNMLFFPNGPNYVRSGIEFNPIGQRVAYWFWKTHPGDSTIFAGHGERVRVPAEQVLHLYKPLRPGQIRGRPWLTAGMVKLHDLDQYDDAELVRKKGSAMFMAFITQSLGEDLSTTGLVPDGAQVDSYGNVEVTMEPGATPVLPAGQDVKFSKPEDVGPNYEMYQYRNLLSLCASMGLPYFSVTGDTAKANYSSLRAALVEAKRRIEQFQWETLIFQMCRPVWNRWLPLAVMSGAVDLPNFAMSPRIYSRVKWITPKWDWVDPLKDAQAEKLMVDAGFKARSDVIEERGEDPEDVDNRIAADHEREKKLGLAFAVGFSKQPDQPAGSDIRPTGSDQQE